MSAVIGTVQVRGRAPTGNGNQGGGRMDDVLKRLGALESLASETHADVSAIKTALQHTATKEEIGGVKAEVGAIKAVLEHTATRADIGFLRAEISAAETRLTRWMIGTLFLAASSAFGFAKLVN